MWMILSVLHNLIYEDTVVNECVPWSEISSLGILASFRKKGKGVELGDRGGRRWGEKEGERQREREQGDQIMTHFSDHEETWERINTLTTAKTVFSWMKTDFLKIALIGHS